ncbi:MAG: c-type cytochrome [Candidatus Promineifilaceae bacterium]
MQAGTMRRLSMILFGGGMLLLLVSFLPGMTARQEIPATPTQQIPTPTATTELSQEQLVSEGAALFVAKGCVICHRNDAVRTPDFSAQIGPNLTHYQPDPDFVRAWLHDPASIRPDTEMPNLNLSDEEIEALLAFLER